MLLISSTLFRTTPETSAQISAQLGRLLHNPCSLYGKVFPFPSAALFKSVNNLLAPSGKEKNALVKDVKLLLDCQAVFWATLDVWA